MSSRTCFAAISTFAAAFAFAACEPREQAIPPVVDPATVQATPGPGQPGGPKATPKPGDWRLEGYKNPLEQRPGDTKKKK